MDVSKLVDYLMDAVSSSHFDDEYRFGESQVGPTENATVAIEINAIKDWFGSQSKDLQGECMVEAFYGREVEFMNAPWTFMREYLIGWTEFADAVTDQVIQRTKADAMCANIDRAVDEQQDRIIWGVQ